MASDNETSCASDPNFAVICSFLEKFAKSCGITHPNMLELQEMLENTQEVPQPLIDLHVKLLRKARKSVSGERWEKAIIKFCHSYSNQDGWEIERFGYKKARIAVKLRILKMLLELQFDLNAKFKTEVNRLSADELRCQPLGRDKMGQTYWCQLDDCNLRVYREDLDDETWEVVARDREGLVQLISQLSSNDPFRKEAEGLLNEDSNSLEIEKPITDTGQVGSAATSEDDDEEFEEIDDDDDDDDVSEDEKQEGNVPDIENVVGSVAEKDECAMEKMEVNIVKNERDIAKKEDTEMTLDSKITKDLQDTTKKKVEIETKKEIETEIKKEIETETKKEIERETKKEVERETKKEVERETKKEVERETKKEVERETKKEVEMETKKEVEMETKKEVEMETKKEVETETKKEVEMVTKKKVETEGKEKVETEGKEEVETETKKDVKTEIKMEDEPGIKDEVETSTNKNVETETKKIIENVTKKVVEPGIKKALDVAAKKELEAVAVKNLKSKTEDVQAGDEKNDAADKNKAVANTTEVKAEIKQKVDSNYKGNLQLQSKEEHGIMMKKESLVNVPQSISAESFKLEGKTNTESSKDELHKLGECIPHLLRERPLQENIPQSELVGMDLSKPSKPRDKEPCLSSNIGIDLRSKTYAEECILQSMDKIESMNESSTSSSSLVAEDLSDSSKRLQQTINTYEHSRFGALSLTATDLSTKRSVTSDLLQVSKVPIMGNIPEFSSLPVNRINLSGKRLLESDLMTNEAKKLRLEHTVATNCHKLLPSAIAPLLSHYDSGSFDSEDSTEVGEAIEEPLMLVRGEGSGADCDTGNPGKDGNDEKNNCETAKKDQILQRKSERSEVSQDNCGKSTNREVKESDERRFDASTSDISETSIDHSCESVSPTKTMNTPKEEEPVEKVTVASFAKEQTVSPALKQLKQKFQDSGKSGSCDSDSHKTNIPAVERIYKAKDVDHHPSTISQSSSETPVAKTIPSIDKDKSKEGELSQSPPKHPKLWSIETICAPDEKAKDIQKSVSSVTKASGASFLGIVSDSLYGEKYNTKLQDLETTSSIPSGSSSPTKRPSRWDMECTDKSQKKGESEFRIKGSILQNVSSGAVKTSEQRKEEADLSKSSRAAADQVTSNLQAALSGATDAARTSKSNIVVESRVQIAGAVTRTSADGGTPEKPAEMDGWRAQEKSSPEKHPTNDSPGDAKNSNEKLPVQGFFFGPGCLMKSPIKKTENSSPTTTGDFDKVSSLESESLMKQENFLCDIESALASKNTVAVEKDQIVQEKNNSPDSTSVTSPVGQSVPNSLAKTESPLKTNTSHTIDTIMMSPHKPKDASNIPHPFHTVASLPSSAEISRADVGKHSSENSFGNKPEAMQVGEKGKHCLSSDPLTSEISTNADNATAPESQVSTLNDEDSKIKSSSANDLKIQVDEKVESNQSNIISGILAGKSGCQTIEDVGNKTAKDTAHPPEHTADSETKHKPETDNLDIIERKVKDFNEERGPSGSTRNLTVCAVRDADLQQKQTSIVSTSVTKDCAKILHVNKSAAVVTSKGQGDSGKTSLVSQEVSITNKELSDVDLLSKKDVSNDMSKKDEVSSNVTLPENAAAEKPVRTGSTVTDSIQTNTRSQTSTTFHEKDVTLAKKVDESTTNEQTLRGKVESTLKEINSKNSECIIGKEQTHINVASIVNAKGLSSSVKSEGKSDHDLKQKCDSRTKGYADVSPAAAEACHGKSANPNTDRGLGKIGMKTQNTTAVSPKNDMEDTVKGVGKENAKISLDKVEKNICVSSEESERNLENKSKIIHDNISVSKYISASNKEGNICISETNVKSDSSVTLVNEIATSAVQVSSSRNIDVPVRDIEANALCTPENQEEVVNKVKDVNKGEELVPSTLNIHSLSKIDDGKNETRREASEGKIEHISRGKEGLVDSVVSAEIRSESTCSAKPNIESKSFSANDKKNVTCGFIGKKPDTKKSCSDKVDMKTVQQHVSDNAEPTAHSSNLATESKATAKIRNTSGNVLEDVGKTKHCRSSKDNPEIKSFNAENNDIEDSIEQNKSKTVSSSSDKAQVKSITDSEINKTETLHISKDENETKSLNAPETKVEGKVDSISKETGHPKCVLKADLKANPDIVPAEESGSNYVPDSKELTSCTTTCESGRIPVIDLSIKTENNGTVPGEENIVEPSSILPAFKTKHDSVSDMNIETCPIAESGSLPINKLETESISVSTSKISFPDNKKSKENIHVGHIKSVSISESKLETIEVTSGDITTKAIDGFKAKSCEVSEKPESVCDITIKRKPSVSLEDSKTSDKTENNLNTVALGFSRNANVKSIEFPNVGKNENVPISREESNHPDTVSESCTQNNIKVSANVASKETEVNKEVDEIKSELLLKVETKFTALPADKTSKSTPDYKDAANINVEELQKVTLKAQKILDASQNMPSEPLSLDKKYEPSTVIEVQQSDITTLKNNDTLKDDKKNSKSTDDESKILVAKEQSKREMKVNEEVGSLSGIDKEIDTKKACSNETNIPSMLEEKKIAIQKQEQKSIVSSHKMLDNHNKVLKRENSEATFLPEKLAHEKPQNTKHKESNVSRLADADNLSEEKIENLNLNIKVQIPTSSRELEERCDENSEVHSQRKMESAISDMKIDKRVISGSHKSSITESTEHKETCDSKASNSKIPGTEKTRMDDVISTSHQIKQSHKASSSTVLSSIITPTQIVEEKPHSFQVPSKELVKCTSSPKSPVGRAPTTVTSKVKADSQNKGRRKSLESISMGIMMGKLAAKSSLQEPGSYNPDVVCEQALLHTEESGPQTQMLFGMPSVISSQENERGSGKVESSKIEPHLQFNKTLPLKHESDVLSENTSSIQKHSDTSKSEKTCISHIAIDSESKNIKEMTCETVIPSLVPAIEIKSPDISLKKDTLSSVSELSAVSDEKHTKDSAPLSEVTTQKQEMQSLSLSQKQTKINLPEEDDIPLALKKVTSHANTDNNSEKNSDVSEINESKICRDKESNDHITENKGKFNDSTCDLKKQESNVIENTGCKDLSAENGNSTNVHTSVYEKQESNINEKRKNKDEISEKIINVDNDFGATDKHNLETHRNDKNKDQNIENKMKGGDETHSFEEHEMKSLISDKSKNQNLESKEQVDKTCSEKQECKTNKSSEFEDQNIERKKSLNDADLDKEDVQEKKCTDDKDSILIPSQNVQTNDHLITISSSQRPKVDMKEEGSSEKREISDECPASCESQHDSEVFGKSSEGSIQDNNSISKLEERKDNKSDIEDLSEVGFDNSQDVQDESSEDDADNDDSLHIPDDSAMEEISDEPKVAPLKSRKRSQSDKQARGHKRSRVKESGTFEATGAGSSSEGEERVADQDGSSDECESEAGIGGKRGGSVAHVLQKGGRGRRGRRRGARGRSTTQKSTTRKSTSPASTADLGESKTEGEESTKIDVTPSKPKSNRGKRAPKLLGLDLGVDIVLEESRGGDEGRPGAPPVRQSRRIAQMKIREEAERRKLEEMTLQQLKEEQSRRRADARAEKKELKGEGKKRKKKIVESDEDFTAEEVDEESMSKKKFKKKKKRRKKKPALSFNESNPWQSSSGSSTSQEEDEEEAEQTEEEEEDDEELIFKSDHEFSPESDLEDDAAEITPTRRARTAQKGQPCADDEEVPADEHACQKCGKSDHPEWILLCDKCDSGWHGSCLRPALMVIPEGDWFCPPCEHTFLLENLHNNLLEFDRNWKRRENEELRRKRLAYVGISLDNVLPNKEKESGSGGESGTETKKEPIVATPSGSDSSGSESRSSSDDDSEPVYQLRQRRQTLFSYRFNEYDDLINSAIQDEMEAVKGAGNQGRGKDIATIVKAEAEEMQASQQIAEVQEKSEVVQEKMEENDEPICNEKEQEEMPCVVPKHEVKEEEDDDEFCPFKKFQIKKKHRRLNSLDISSEDDAESDEDFKGTSSDDDDDEYEEASEGESDDSEFAGRRGKGSRRRSSGPVRRSSRARITRFDKEFINDDSEDSEPPKKKARRLWQDTESEESDASWRHSKRSKKQVTTYKTKSKKKKKKRSKREVDSDLEVYKAKKPKIKYGGLEEDEVSPTRRTRGRKINYQELAASDSEEETWGRTRKIESEDEYVANEEDEEEEEDEPLPEVEKDSENESGDHVMSKKTIKTKPEKKGKLKKNAKGTPDKNSRKGRKPKAKKAVIDSDEETVMPTGDMLVANVHEDANVGDGISQEASIQVSNAEISPITVTPLSLADQPKEKRGRTRGQGRKQEEQKKKGKRKKKGENSTDDVSQGLIPGIRPEKGDTLLLGQQTSDVPLLSSQSRTAAELSAKSGDALIQRLGSGRAVTITLKSNSELLPENDRAMLLQSGKGVIETDPLRSLLAAPPVIPPDGELKVNEEVPPPAGKRRGRGRGKAAITVTDSSKASDVGHYPSLQGFPAQSGAGIGNANSSSVITRMLQTQPVSGAPQSFTAAAAAMGHKYFGTSAGESSLMPMQNAGRGTSSVPSYSGPPKGLPSPYRQPPPSDSSNPNLGPGMGHYGSSSPVRGSGIRGPPGFSQTGSLRLRNPPPGNQQHMFHTSHHPMDPSPSGGGPIIISSGTGPPPPPTGSPLTTKPGTPSTSHSTPTPPPPPYSRASSQLPLAPPSSTTMSSIVQFPLQPGDTSQPPSRHPTSPFPPATSASHLQTSQTAQQSPPPPHQGRSPVPGNFSPYHPPPPANYHYGGYPPPPPMSAADDALPPSAFQGSPYTDHYTSSDMTANLQASDGSNSKSYDEEGGGEFGGLVSYFSSQREDDLDT